jgi:hypothetical protein
MHVHTRSGAYAASYSMSIRGYFHWVRRPGHEADFLPPSGGRVENEWSNLYRPTPPP